jgi:nicotinamide-nucleotide amidase
VTGVPESTLYEKIRTAVEGYFGQIDIAFLPKATVGVDIRLTVTGKTRELADKLIGDAEKELVEAINAHFENAVYGFDHDTMEQAVAELLFKSGETIATAESCTGGLIAHRLTNVAGSSRYFLQGFTTYSNESKIRELSIPAGLIGAHGAVSEEVAKALASGVRERAGADIGLSTTGIAGPTGGTETKPVGLVYIGLATEKETRVVKPLLLPYPLDRLTFKERTSQAALDILRKYLLGRDRGGRA